MAVRNAFISGFEILIREFIETHIGVHKDLIVFFGVISVDLLQTASDEKDVGAYLLLSVSASVSVSV